MAQFTPRTTAPKNTDRHYYSNENPFFVQTGMRNCTTYAWGRFYELTDKRPNILGQPEDWFANAKANGYQVGQEPKLGAIAVWKKGDVKNPKDGTGHVNVVEKIYDNGDFDSSNSQYNGKQFFMQRITKASGYKYAGGFDLLGFIYCGIEFEDAAAASSTSTSNIVLKAGAKFVLNNIDIYTSEKGAVFGKRTGTYYVWEDKEVAEGTRVRMTNHPTRVGVKGQVSFLVETTDLVNDGIPEQAKKPVSTIVKAGTKITLNNASVYTSEKGAAVGTRSGIYYTWEQTDTAKEKRVRMTNSPARVGVARQVSFFIDNSLLK